ncbi:AAA family ATPase [Hymenobacter psoromatis]|uniref:AAA family ATPase n=1 Tax=Hymenobacter psoromatis TaxID=1484116 RepID=UPI001CBB5B1C|nr:AAA family ATPase [Hymenobacter psoromatis]
MLKSLYVKNFTVFAEANFEFGSGLNVVVGTNGTGKSHVLKLGYAVLFNSAARLKELRNMAAHSKQTAVSGSFDFVKLEEKLKGVFGPVPNDLSELVRRGAEPAEATIRFSLSDEPLIAGNLNFGTGESDGSSFENLTTPILMRVSDSLAAPVLIPAKEILTLGWIVPAYDQLVLSLDESYLDLLKQLSGLSLRKPEPAAAAALQQLTTILGGGVQEDNGRFYLVFPKEKRLEMNMVAEGLRKFGTLQKLLANGRLTLKSTLFWDEPEANLNPALLKKLAAVLAELARQGFQIILATHSSFLLKQLHILNHEKTSIPLPIHYFGLNAQPGESTVVTTTNDFAELPDIVALDEELAQAGEFLDVLNDDE